MGGPCTCSFRHGWALYLLVPSWVGRVFVNGCLSAQVHKTPEIRLFHKPNGSGVDECQGAGLSCTLFEQVFE